jgi:hypothetical protein
MTPSGSKGDSIYGQGEGDKAQDGGDMDGSRTMSLSPTSNSAIHGSLSLSLSLSHTHTHKHTSKAHNSISLLLFFHTIGCP